MAALGETAEQVAAAKKEVRTDWVVQPTAIPLLEARGAKEVVEGTAAAVVEVLEGFPLLSTIIKAQ